MELKFSRAFRVYRPTLYDVFFSFSCHLLALELDNAVGSNYSLVVLIDTYFSTGEYLLKMTESRK